MTDVWLQMDLIFHNTERMNMLGLANSAHSFPAVNSIMIDVLVWSCLCLCDKQTGMVKIIDHTNRLHIPNSSKSTYYAKTPSDGADML